MINIDDAPPMRSRDEVQRAHDLIVQLLFTYEAMKERCPGSPSLNEETLLSIKVSADMCCWMLRHDHNTDFAENLKNVEWLLRQLGFEAVDSGKLLTLEEARAAGLWPFAEVELDG